MIPLYPLLPASYDRCREALSVRHQNQLEMRGFEPVEGQSILLTDAEGKAETALLIVERADDCWSFAAAAESLPHSLNFHVTDEADWAESCPPYAIVLGWELAQYEFGYESKPAKKYPSLTITESAETRQARQLAESIFIARDLINEPANIMHPEALAKAVQDLAAECDAEYFEVVGEDLLQQNYPCIHAVGRACEIAPRLAELRWGDTAHPKLTLVGKGVCFDTGGLNIKTGKSMGLMKKDMGGAAFMIGLARMVMLQQLPVRLRLLIPAVENSISGNAYRPQDVLHSRIGKTIEVSNTDAEGRLILCDALAAANEEAPDLVIDAATLTGAARVATGTEVPAFFASNPTLADALRKGCEASHEMLWELPLWKDYRYMLNSDVADIDHSSASGYAGAITAALFLNEFAPDCPNWLHIDMMAWNTRSRPGRPKGGEAQGIQAVLTFLKNRYPH